MEKKEQGFITILYGLAVMLVIFGHSHPLHTEYPLVLHEITGFIYTFHMPLFFFIAGILVAYTADGRHTWKWWKKKAGKLLLPYVVLTLIAWVPKTILGAYMTDNMEFSGINVVRILMIPREGIWGHFWFIPVYLIISLVCAALYGYLSNTNIGSKILMGGVVVALGIILTLRPIPVKWFGISDFSVECVYTLWGMLCSKAIIREKEKVCKGLLAGIAFVISVAMYVMDGSNIENKIISLLMIYVVLVLSVQLSRFDMNIVKYMGRHAFTIYIYSWPIQAVIEFILAVLLKCPWYVLYPCMFAAGLGGPLMLYEFYIRFIPKNKFLDAMIGAKNERHVCQNASRTSEGE